jgi:type I restriction enzyme, S subunit
MNEEFKIPDNWKVVTFEDISEGKNAIVDGPFGSNLKTSDYINDKVNGVPVLTTKNLEGDYSDDKVRFISKEKFEELRRSQVNPGDILVAKIGSIGKTGIYPKNAKTAIIPANLLKFTVSKKVNFNFVFYYLNSRGLQNRIKKISTATAQPAFNLTKFRRLQIPLPPISEQQTIVSKIEELLSDLENGKQQLLLAQQQLKVYRQSLLKWAFEGKLTDRKEEWNFKPFNECLKFSQGIQVDVNLQSEDYNSEKVRFLRIIDFTQGKDAPRYIINPGERYLVAKEDIALVRYGATTGFVCTGLEGAIANNLFKVTPVGSILNRYLFYFLISSKFQDIISQSVKGAAMPAISFGLINDVILPIPSVSEQQLIVDELESKLTVCDKIEDTISQSLLQAESLRQSILKKAFEGKLV